MRLHRKRAFTPQCVALSLLGKELCCSALPLLQWFGFMRKWKGIKNVRWACCVCRSWHRRRRKLGTRASCTCRARKLLTRSCNAFRRR